MENEETNIVSLDSVKKNFKTKESKFKMSRGKKVLLATLLVAALAAGVATATISLSNFIKNHKKIDFEGQTLESVIEVIKENTQLDEQLLAKTEAPDESEQEETEEQVSVYQKLVTGFDTLKTGEQVKADELTESYNKYIHEMGKLLIQSLVINQEGIDSKYVDYDNTSVNFTAVQVDGSEQVPAVELVGIVTVTYYEVPEEMREFNVDPKSCTPVTKTYEISKNDNLYEALELIEKASLGSLSVSECKEAHKLLCRLALSDIEFKKEKDDTQEISSCLNDTLVNIYTSSLSK